jgi:hypothetical protein
MSALSAMLKSELIPWIEPYTQDAGDGLVVFWWTNKNKRLAFYFGNHDRWSLRSWGPDANTEMEEGDLTPSDRQLCWSWFTSV